MAATIYLHWTATGYDWIRPGRYHSIISGDGRVHRLHAYSVDLPAHTYARNSNAVALSCACMGGKPDPWSQPPTPDQLQGLCAETAAIARSWGWHADDITISTVMTHAEAASNRDGRIMHDNYGPVIWGGTGERWDLLQLERNGSVDGGDQLRARIRHLLQNATLSPTDAPQALEPSAPLSAMAPPGAAQRLQFSRTSMMTARGEPLTVAIDHEGRSWALTADLLDRYGISYSWDSNQKRVLIGNLDVAPSFREDGVQADVGWPLFEMTLESSQAAVILRGILRPSAGDAEGSSEGSSEGSGDRSWCRVLEFAEEFGISVHYDPFTLGERRGG